MVRATVLVLMSALFAMAQPDTSTLDGKVLLGYQGWFRCPGGTNGTNWSHWSNGTPSAATLVIDMYPDLREFEPGEACAVPGMSIGGRPAALFSSANSRTVDRHFEWMRHYGLDGVLLQRFLTDIPGLRAAGDPVLRNAMAAARRHGRVFAIEYDISGANPATVAADLRNDWTYLVNTIGVTAHPLYLKPEGKPLVSVWGIGLNEARHPPDDPDAALQLIEWFRAEAKVFYMGGTPSYWRTLNNDSQRDNRWAGVYRAMDAIQPWTVGRYNNVASADRWKTSQVAPDLAAASSRGQAYMPVIFPGFSWYNLNRTAAQNQIPRARGEFLWRQAANVRAAGVRMLKIAMFDEVNESTAMFKLASRRQDAPEQGYWLTLDADGFALPSDWYLRLAGEIARGFRRSAPLTEAMPEKPGPPWAEPGSPAPAVVNAAGYSRGPVAADSIATVAGATLPIATGTEPAVLSAIEATGQARAARVLYAGAGQWNFVVPAGTARGAATLVLTASGAAIVYAGFDVEAVSPGIFTASANGQGVAAALARVVRADGSQSVSPVFACGAGGVCRTLPVDLGSGADTVFLELYGTGIRGRSSLAAVACRIGGAAAGVIYAGPQSASSGLDQINVELPRSLAGRGSVRVEVSVDGAAANAVEIEVR